MGKHRTGCRKIEMVKADPKVVFQIDNSELHGPFRWESVFGDGVFEIVTSEDTIDEIKHRRRVSQGERSLRVVASP